MTSAPETIIFDDAENLKSILARRGVVWGFAGPVAPAWIEAFRQVIATHIAEAAEVWQAPYRGSDRLFYIKEDKVVVVQLDGTFESAWRATPAQLAHYRTGVKVK